MMVLLTQPSHVTQLFLKILKVFSGLVIQVGSDDAQELWASSWVASERLLALAACLNAPAESAASQCGKIMICIDLSYESMPVWNADCDAERVDQFESCTR